MREATYKYLLLYADIVLCRYYNEVIRNKYAPQDAFQDAYLYMAENGIIITEDDLKIHIRKAITRFKWEFIKNNPNYYENNRLWHKRNGEKIRKTLGNIYIKDMLKRRGIEVTETNISETKKIIMAHRENKTKQEKLKVVDLPELPPDCILINSIKEYENLYGYAVNVKTFEVFSCRNTLRKWTLKKPNKHGQVSLSINGPITKQFHPRLIFSRLEKGIPIITARQYGVHPSQNTYKGGCRCDGCKEAHRKHNRKYIKTL